MAFVDLLDNYWFRQFDEQFQAKPYAIDLGLVQMARRMTDSPSLGLKQIETVMEVVRMAPLDVFALEAISQLPEMSSEQATASVTSTLRCIGAIEGMSGMFADIGI